MGRVSLTTVRGTWQSGVSLAVAGAEAEEVATEIERGQIIQFSPQRCGRRSDEVFRRSRGTGRGSLCCPTIPVGMFIVIEQVGTLWAMMVFVLTISLCLTLI